MDVERAPAVRPPHSRGQRPGRERHRRQRRHYRRYPAHLPQCGLATRPVRNCKSAPAFFPFVPLTLQSFTMLPDLNDIETNAGRISLGSTVRSTRYHDVQGIVTLIRWTGYWYSIQVDGRHSDNAANYELLSTKTFPGFNYVNPNAQQALSGKFEVELPGEGERIYFADTAEQAIALVAAAIGLRDEQGEVAYLKRRAEAGRVDQLRWRGCAASCAGQLAYISTGQVREAPRFAVGDCVSFFHGAANTVSGVALYKDRRNHGQVQWHYFYAAAQGKHRPMSEADTQLVTKATAKA